MVEHRTDGGEDVVVDGQVGEQRADRADQARSTRTQPVGDHRGGQMPQHARHRGLHEPCGHDQSRSLDPVRGRAGRRQNDPCPERGPHHGRVVELERVEHVHQPPAVAVIACRQTRLRALAWVTDGVGGVDPVAAEARREPPQQRRAGEVAAAQHHQRQCVRRTRHQHVGHAEPGLGPPLLNGDRQTGNGRVVHLFHSPLALGRAVDASCHTSPLSASPLAVVSRPTLQAVSAPEKGRRAVRPASIGAQR